MPKLSLYNRAQKEGRADKLMQRIIAVDLDNCIAEYDGWKGISHFGKPIKRTVARLRREKKKGAWIIIHTCRINQFNWTPHNDLPSIVMLIARYLSEHDIPFDQIWCEIGKPIADEYWDDRAVRISTKNTLLKYVS